MRRQFATRIAIIFGLWAAVVAILYSVLFVFLTQSAEDRLMRDLLTTEAASFEQASNHDSDTWQPNSRFVQAGETPADLGIVLPEGFDPDAEGFQEFTDEDGRVLQAVSLDPNDDSRSRIIILDTTEASAMASNVGSYTRYVAFVGLAVLLVTALVSFIVGRGAAQPIEALSALVSARSPDHAPKRFADQFGEGEIGTLAGALEDSLFEARDALDRERAFNHGISHELRSSLQVAEHALELIRLGVDAPPNAEALARLTRAMDSMRGASEAFLWLALPDRTAELEEPVGEAVDSAIYRLSGAADKRGVNVNFKIETETELAIPSAVIGVIVENLLRNSIQHSGAEHIHVDLNAEGLTIQDSGRGIAPDKLRAINRGEAPADADGIGLGLVLCRRLCERFGGQLNLHSEGLGHGTKVEWTFVGAQRFALGAPTKGAAD
jgi:signal transduction histidine kinase